MIDGMLCYYWSYNCYDILYVILFISVIIDIWYNIEVIIVMIYIWYNVEVIIDLNWYYIIDWNYNWYNLILYYYVEVIIDIIWYCIIMLKL